ncbi:hypothetical protein CLV28_2748 [Sediminihabitans luteus]|uniref:DUF2087 domain-containing protein n=1 Tax=Sediminihabitans luteus TaxID=1138585 RepID=A0A2M9CD90_9CELL|nr:DUF2087 domain-containing protein [Sediminihabitans luteus]PJJ69283.1 hypothetical protein CLV28_2748 [Sediminihabitans luteus]
MTHADEKHADKKHGVNAWRQVVAALADDGRLALFGALVTAAAQDAPLRREDLSTDQRRRLAPLVAAGIVADDAGGLVPRPGRFRELLVAASSAEPVPAAGPERFLVAGRLESMPRRRDDRDAVVRLLATAALPLQEPTDERSLMRVLAGLADDPVGLRRAMVDAGLVQRTADGSSYWRTTVTEHDGV